MALHVLPASHLSDERVSLDGEEEARSLREEASCDGWLCYVRVLRQIRGTDLYQAHVAATPEWVKTQPITIYLTEEQLASALPWDCRVESQPAARILRMASAHAASLRRGVRAEAVTPTLVPKQEAQVHHSASPEEALQPLENVLISEHELAPHLKSTLSPSGVLKRSWWTRMQQGLLRALLARLSRQLAQTSDKQTRRSLRARTTLLKRLLRFQQRTRRLVVHLLSSAPSYLQWKFQVLAPARFLTAA
jgi:hypothetical protein